MKIYRKSHISIRFYSLLGTSNSEKGMLNSYNIIKIVINKCY